MASPRLTNYVAYRRHDGAPPQIGHLDQTGNTIQPLTFLSGTPVDNLYQVIEAGCDQIIAADSDPAIPLKDVRLLAPISGRDILAVGKNYMEHAKEFNSSGYDSSDKVDRPSHPVIFTKRATSIIANGEEILLHKGFTESADFEGEIGVIVGKAGFHIAEADAWDHVWGYTIINDMTARERQRDHKQFFIGKSPDTYCPMGPIAVPKEDLPKTLRLKTHVNGELRQNATSDDLIFSIPHLISTLSAGQTLQPGDVIATGTVSFRNTNATAVIGLTRSNTKPAGVGIGRNPPVFLQPGDEIAITVDGLGTLTNKVAPESAANSTFERVSSQSAFHFKNADRTMNCKAGLTIINSKPIHHRRIGSGKEVIVFLHGLGATQEFWTPLLSTLSLPDTASVHLFDCEGQGLSPTHPLSVISIESLAADLGGILELAGASADSPATLIGHSMGAVISAKFALDHPSLVKRLVIIGAPSCPFPEPNASSLRERAVLARSHGMSAIVDQIVAMGISNQTISKNPLAAAAVRLSILSQEPTSYAKAALALANFTQLLPLEKLELETLVISGEEDTISPPSLGEELSRKIRNSRHVVLPGVGHWHVFEDAASLGRSIEGFL